MREDCPLVIIRWQDSRQPCGQWRFVAALPEAKAVEVASVGWLLTDTPDVKVLCQNVGDLENPDHAQASGIMTIPTRCVISIETLSENDADGFRELDHEKFSPEPGPGLAHSVEPMRK